MNRPDKKIVKLSLLNPGDVFVLRDDKEPYVFLRNVYIKPLGERIEREGLTNKWDSFMKLGGHSLCVRYEGDGSLELKDMDLLVEPNIIEKENLSTEELSFICKDIAKATMGSGYPSKDYYDEEPARPVQGTSSHRRVDPIINYFNGSSDDGWD